MTHAFDAPNRGARLPGGRTEAAGPARATAPAVVPGAARRHGDAPPPGGRDAPERDFSTIAGPGRPAVRRRADAAPPDFAGIEAPGRAPAAGGLPAGLRSAVEARSGLSMENVRVHRNSPQPERIRALAYARGRDIHLGPGQERHLPHEAWHVVQQKQGRVRPTRRVGGMPVNDDPGLEREADALGAHAAPHRRAPAADPGAAGPGVVQRSIGFEYEFGNVDTYSKDPATGAVARLPKGHVLEARTNFSVTADDPPTGSAPGALSDMELITPPIDDTVAANRDGLRTTLVGMVAYLGHLKAHPVETAAGADFLCPNLPPQQAAVAYDDGMLQATAGLSRGGLANMVSGRTKASAGAASDQAAAERAALDRTRFVFGNRRARESALDQRIAHAAKQELLALGQTEKHLFDSCLPQLDANLSPHEADLAAAVMSRIIAIPYAARTTSTPLPYPKSAAGALMARTDFASVLAALPPAIMAGFGSASAFGLTLLAALRFALNAGGANGPAVQLADPIFPHALGGAVPLTLTLDAWFGGLYPQIGRTDLLTTANYPGGPAADPERQQLESLGSRGNLTDPPAAGAVRRPIFEFRNLGSIPTDALVETGLAVWDMVQRANDGTEN